MSDREPGLSIPGGILLLLFSAACGENEDAADDPASMCPEETIRFDGDCLVDCPEGWGRGPDNRCRPPCLDGEDLEDGECVRPCPEGTARKGAGNLCIPERARDFSACPADLYNEEDAVGERVYVRQSADAAVSDGSRAAPFTTLGQAVDALETMTASEITVLVAAGSYNIDGLRLVLLDKQEKISIVGKCAQQTILVAAPTETGVSIHSGKTRFVFTGLSFQGGADQLVVNDAVSTSIENCSFFDWTGQAAILSSEIDELIVKSSSFSVTDVQDTVAISSFARALDIAANEFHVITDGGESLFAYRPQAMTLVGNRIEGRGRSGVTLNIDKQAGSVLIRSNAFDGDWAQAGLSILGADDGAPTMTLESTSIENHTTLGEKKAFALSLRNIVDVAIRDLRVETGNIDAVYVDSVRNLTISDSTFCNVNWSGLVVESHNNLGSCAVTVSRSRFTGIEAYPIFHDNADCGLSLRDNVFEDNRRGIFASARTFSARSNDIGAVDDIAVNVRGAESGVMRDNTVASVEGAGIALSNLQTAPGEQYIVDGNRVFDCQGVGLMLNGTGEGGAALLNNEIQGVRGRRYERQDAAGIMGDGVLVTSYSKEVETRVEMSGNTVGRNARLGVLAHGPGSTVAVSDTRFETGNGYARLIPDKAGERCDLLLQAGARVSGSDEQRAEVVEGIFTVQDARSRP